MKTTVTIPNGFDLNHSKSSFEDLRITDQTDIPLPEPIIKIGDSLLSTRGNITTISGASKSGKSAFTSWILVGAIANENAEKFEYLSVYPNKNSKAVIHIDTEQSRHKQQKNIKSILKRSGYEYCPEFYLSYNIRQLDLSEYKDKTRAICKEAEQRFGGIHLIVIDGIADYIKDVNDGTESNEIVKFFMDIAEEHQTPVVVIVHTNPGSDKERGHLGSQCQRKSESVITVRHENGVSTIEPKFLREAGLQEMPRIKFVYDSLKDYHVSCGLGSSTKEERQSQKNEYLQQLSEQVFGDNATYEYNEAIQQIMIKAKRQIATAKGLFTEMKNLMLISQSPDKKWQLK